MLVNRNKLRYHLIYLIQELDKMKTINISPSDLAFLYLESPWGFYQKYNLGVKRPPLILPKIFTVIDTLMKCKFSDENFKSICPNYPDAVLKDADQWVKSKPIRNPKFPDIEIVLRGKIDGVLKYPDNTYSIIDFKTSDVKSDVAKKYLNQLSCYTYALTYPNSSKDYSLPMNNKAGLFIYEPKNFDVDLEGMGNLSGSFSWHEYEVDLVKFESFIADEVIPLLAGSQPEPTDSDPCWVYLKQFEYTED
jgi:hypothetical protein